MTSDPDSGEWSGVEEVLERYFMAREAGEAIDLEAECAGDERLLARVRHALKSTPEMFREDSRATVPSETVFDDFAIIKEIGRGGMGTVYLARQQSLGRDVALKVLDVSNAEASARARMKREAELTALLDHPNIVPIYAVGDSGEVPFLAMKLLAGPSLAQVERPWTPERVAKVGIELAEALDFAHLRGVVHRDVKPANILLDGDSAVFVDFGLARAQSDPTLTQEGKVAGTLRYMAPERLDARSPVLDPRIDVYGLGATLYELLAGHEMFDDENPTALVRSVLMRDPAPLQLRGRHHDLETIIQRALAKEPRRRFASARELADDLQRYLDGEPVASRRLSRTARVMRLVRRFPRISAALGTLLLAALVLTVVIVTQSLEAQADRERRLENARSDLRLRRHAHARDSLELLFQLHPGDVEVERALQRARSEVALDKLVFAAADNRRNLDADVLQELTVAAEKSAMALSAAIVALGQLQEQAMARERLATLVTTDHDGRLVAAIEAWFAKAPHPWKLPAGNPSREVDAVLLTAMVMRIAAAAPADVLDEIELVDASGRDRPRAVFFEAIVRADLGELDAAEGLFRGLAREDAAPPVWRWLANVQLRRGKVAEAGYSLQRAERDRSPPADYLRRQHAFMSAMQTDDQDRLAELLEELRAEPDRSSQEERFLAEYEGKNDPDAVTTSLQRLGALEQSATTARRREMLVADQVEIGGWHLLPLDEVPTLAPNDPNKGTEKDPLVVAAKAHKDIVGNWRERVDALLVPQARDRARTWIARSLCNTGKRSDLADGLELFAETCRDDPGNMRATLEFLRAVALLPADVSDVVRRFYGAQACTAADQLLRRVGEKKLSVAGEVQDQIRQLAWFLAARTGDHIDAARRLPAMRHLMSASDYETSKRTADWALKQLESFRNQ